MKKILAIVAVLAFLVACESKKEIKRPRDPWVFRSVLDKQPRMITATLADEMYVAYDARYCGLYKAWKGEVILDGPVYTTKHGPQPTSEGYAYFEQRLSEPAWRLVVDGKETIPTAQFKGHYFKDDQVTFRFKLTDSQGNYADVEETPEYIKKSGKNGLHRKFTIKETTQGVGVALKTSLTNLQQEGDYETTGSITVDSTSSVKYPDGSAFNVAITLLLNKDKETDLKVYYHPGFKIESSEALTAKSILEQGKTLIDGSDCRTCHNEGVKTVGPAYLDVAKKYAFTTANIKILSEKVIKGGSGVWGQVVMNPHPDLMQEDAEKMLNYILSLDGEKLAVENKLEELNLHLSTIPVPFSDKNEFEKEEDGKEYPGLAASMYKIIDMADDVYALPKKSSPVLTGVAPAVHIPDGLEKFEGMVELVFIQFNGYVNVEEEGNYVFRVVSDDGSKLFIDNKEIVNNDGDHGAIGRDGEIALKKGKHALRLDYYNNRGGYAISLQWAKHGDNKFSIIPNGSLTHNKKMFKKSTPFVPKAVLVKSIPGDRTPLVDVHPAFDLAQARPNSFEPKVGGMDFLSDSSLIICTWDSVGPVYRLEGVTRNNPEAIKVTRIATGLAEPLGIKVVSDTIYVLQKQELTRLIDTDKDGIIDDYQTVCDAWQVSANFHEFAFGLVYKDGYFYAALATAIEPGGASAKQIPDRGKVVKISKKDGSIEFIAHGLRTPNGVGIGVDGEIFIADNQGDWLPSSKILHVKQGAWYGSRSVDFEGTANLKETLPVVWLPQDEIGNSPSQPAYLNVGPYKNQQLHGEVTHGGLKRVFVEKVNGEYQGVVFRFIQGLEGGVNRVVWGPDGSIYVGMIGNPGNWGQTGKKWFGIQRLTYNSKPVFEMLAVRAKSNGVEIEMTEPIGERYGNSPADYEIKQWYYKPTINYGGPKLDQKNLEIKSVNISDDRKKVFLELKGMEPNHVVYVRLNGTFISTQDRELWSTEAWYTMNQIPQNDPGFKSPAKTVPPNTLTDAEVKAGWELLFDGKSINQWKRFNKEGMSPAWKVKDNSIALDKTMKKGEDHDIVTLKEYENFEFTLEWKIDKNGNSGIMYNVVDNGKYSYPWLTGPEMQVLDNTGHPDAAFEKHRAGDLYDMLATKYVTVNPALEWNSIRLISNKGKVEFWQNGYKVVQFEMHNAAWLDMIKKSKFKDMPDFGLSKKGRIALQDHGDNVWYRNIRIRELK